MESEQQQSTSISNEHYEDYNFVYLPLEIVVEILKLLAPKELGKLKVVSKFFKQLLDSNSADIIWRKSISNYYGTTKLSMQYVYYVNFKTKCFFPTKNKPQKKNKRNKKVINFWSIDGKAGYKLFENSISNNYNELFIKVNSIPNIWQKYAKFISNTLSIFYYDYLKEAEGTINDTVRNKQKDRINEKAAIWAIITDNINFFKQLYYSNLLGNNIENVNNYYHQLNFFSSFLNLAALNASVTFVKFLVDEIRKSLYTKTTDKIKVANNLLQFLVAQSPKPTLLLAASNCNPNVTKYLFELIIELLLETDQFIQVSGYKWELKALHLTTNDDNNKAKQLFIVDKLLNIENIPLLILLARFNRLPLLQHIIAKYYYNFPVTETIPMFAHAKPCDVTELYYETQHLNQNEAYCNYPPFFKSTDPLSIAFQFQHFKLVRFWAYQIKVKVDFNEAIINLFMVSFKLHSSDHFNWVVNFCKDVNGFNLNETIVEVVSILCNTNFKGAVSAIINFNLIKSLILFPKETACFLNESDCSIDYVCFTTEDISLLNYASIQKLAIANKCYDLIPTINLKIESKLKKSTILSKEMYYEVTNFEELFYTSLERRSLVGLQLAAKICDAIDVSKPVPFITPTSTTATNTSNVTELTLPPLLHLTANFRASEQRIHHHQHCCMPCIRYKCIRIVKTKVTIHCCMMNNKIAALLIRLGANVNQQITLEQPTEILPEKEATDEVESVQKIELQENNNNVKEEISEDKNGKLELFEDNEAADLKGVDNPTKVDGINCNNDTDIPSSDTPKLIIPPYIGSKVGYTALHFAAENLDVATALVLLNKGANVNLQTKLGKTALHLVAEHDMYDMNEAGELPMAAILMKRKPNLSLLALKTKNKCKGFNFIEHWLNFKCFALVEFVIDNFLEHIRQSKITVNLNHLNKASSTLLRRSKNLNTKLRQTFNIK